MDLLSISLSLCWFRSSGKYWSQNGCPNRNEYDCVCADAKKYVSEANNFLQGGYYASLLGDAMPLSMANALNSNIIIFRSTMNMPVTFVSPREPSHNIIFVAYSDYGSGHYDSVLYNGAATVHKILSSTSKCRCGVNAKEKDHFACVDTANRHSNCKCLAAKKECSSACKCKGCKNPFGNRVMLGKRKREVHALQKYDIH